MSLFVYKKVYLGLASRSQEFEYGLRYTKLHFQVDVKETISRINQYGNIIIMFSGPGCFLLMNYESKAY